MNLIRERVEKYRKLTTISLQDRINTYREKSDWSIDKAVFDQVQREDILRDAKKPILPFKPVPQLPSDDQKDLLALWRFAKGILP